jgi:hypothetical protein
MRYYVICRGHGGEKVYITFQGRQPTVRGEISASAYEITCPQGSTSIYSRMDIMAEADILPAIVLGGGAGLILSILDPLVGIAGGGAVFSGMVADEEKKVKQFNESVG